MKRFIHGIFRWSRRTLLVLSTLLCVALVALWVRSYYAIDVVGTGHSDAVTIEVSRGHCMVDVMKSNRPGAAGMLRRGWLDFRYYSNTATEDLRARDTTLIEENGRESVYRFEPVVAGCAFKHGASPDIWTSAFLFPLWIPTVLFAIGPAFWTYHLLRRSRVVKPGLCPKCGYDLRASKERCPECGAPIRAAANA